MLRALLAAALVLVPLAHAGEPAATLEEGGGDVTPAGWRGAPLVLGTDCGRTDLRRASLAPAADGIAVTLGVRDVREACLGENPPHQSFGYTLNLLFSDGGEGWAEIELTQSARWGLYAEGSWVVRCDGRVPVPTTRCDDAEGFTRLGVVLDADASTFTYTVPFAWDEVEAVWFASVMWDCSSHEGGHVCVTGSFAGPGDRMPDLGEHPLR